jgi:putative hydrolase of the HAD superfamily
MLETLSLDAGGVLVRPNWPRIAAIFAAHAIRVTAEALDAVELKVMRHLDCEAQVNEKNDNDRLTYFFEQLLDFAGATGTPAARRQSIDEIKRVHGQENLWEHVPDDVIPALERLTAFGLNLIVLSNANGTVRKRFDRLGLSKWFSQIVDSGEEGVEKPDPKFFAIGLARADANPASTLHVGDLFFVDVLGARAAGIRSVLIDRGQLQRDRNCLRFADLGELATAIERGQFD